jgi:arginyl-tRNA synthetase
MVDFAANMSTQWPFTRENVRRDLQNALKTLRAASRANTLNREASKGEIVANVNIGANDYEVNRGAPTKNKAHRSIAFRSNVALVLAASVCEKDAEGITDARSTDAKSIARALIEHLSWPGRVEEANGFLNFQLTPDNLREALGRALQDGERYGANEVLSGTRVLVEFVSSDPVGPLPFSAARAAALGDALCRVLEFAGASVTREYFLNDADSSSKIRLLGESVAAFYLAEFGQEIEPPEGAFNNGFVRSVAKAIAQREGNAHVMLPESERTTLFAHKALEAAISAHKTSLRDLGVRFDVWTSEQTLRDEGRVDAALQKLRERGHLYQKSGAQWIASTQFGDDADHPLVRANGEPTYLATDIAYHLFKLERGFDKIINIWTSEHRQYIARTKAALKAVGASAEKVEVLPTEGARWLREGTPALRGSGGETFSLEDALRATGADTLRFWMLCRDPDSVVDVDSELARRDDETNPAYAARLLPARLAQLIREHEARANGATEPSAENFAFEYSEGEAASELARLIALWPDTVQNAASERAPHRIAQFVGEMAKATRDLLKSQTPLEGEAAAARLPILRAAQNTTTAALRLLGISAATRI